MRILCSQPAIKRFRQEFGPVKVHSCGLSDHLIDDAVYLGPTPEDLAAEHDRYLYEDEH